jgi:hypothetical protein
MLLKSGKVNTEFFILILWLKTCYKCQLTTVVTNVTPLVNQLDVLIEDGPHREPHLTVVADKDLLSFAQVAVVEVHPQTVLALKGSLGVTVNLLAVVDTAHLIRKKNEYIYLGNV